MRRPRLLLASFPCLFLACAPSPVPRSAPAAPAPTAAASLKGQVPSASSEGQWISLFNGKNLDGWTIKMAHHEINDNYRDTFRVEDGLLKVDYARYDQFRGEFGHIFYTGFRRVFSHYRLHIEYRLHGAQVPGGPDWGYRNNGVLIHGQSPESMGLDQDFPTALEVQFLGSDADVNSPARPTGNVCSPGTNVVMDGRLITEHCVHTSSLVVRGDEWVTAEVLVLGNESVTHVFNGQVTATYSQPQYDPKDPRARGVLPDGDLTLSEGTICLQAETHPTDFRKVEIMLLDPEGRALPAP